MSRSSRGVAAVLVSGLLSLGGPSILAGPAGAHAKGDTASKGASSSGDAKVSVLAKKSKQSRSSAVAQSFLGLINEERADAGLDPLRSDPSLASVAQAWSAKMASSGRLAHNPSLRDQVDPGWQRLAENVGTGSGVEVLHRSFMASAGHRGNVLGDFSRVGVGVVEAGGRLWVTVNFLQT